MNNGERILWNTDATWTDQGDKNPVIINNDRGHAIKDYSPKEHLAVYEIETPKSEIGEAEKRFIVSYKGDVANAYLNRQLVADSFYDGTDWYIGCDRLGSDINIYSLIIRIEGLKTGEEPIYFENFVDPYLCVDPVITTIELKKEYRYPIMIE